MFNICSVAVWQRCLSFSSFSLCHIRCWIRAWGWYLNLLIPSTGVISTLVNATCIYMSWYDLPSFLSHLFPPLSVPHPISITFQLHLTLSACLLLPLLQL